MLSIICSPRYKKNLYLGENPKQIVYKTQNPTSTSASTALRSKLKHHPEAAGASFHTKTPTALSNITWLHTWSHTFHETCPAGKTVKVVGGFPGKPAHDQSGEGGLGENVRDEEVEEYLQTANWQLGNRRVRCCLMLDTRRGGKRGKRKTHIYRECTVT